MEADPATAGHGDLDHSALLDVTGIPFDRLMRETSRPQEIIAAFGNFAPDDPRPS